jgi:hypothetical protein
MDMQQTVTDATADEDAYLWALMQKFGVDKEESPSM